MEDVTLQLVKFALDRYAYTQEVASKNIALSGIESRKTVDFDTILSDLKAMPESQQLAMLEQISSQERSLMQSLTTDTGETVAIEHEHAISTKASLEYQAMIEALKRKMSIKSLIFGGNS